MRPMEWGSLWIRALSCHWLRAQHPPPGCMGVVTGPDWKLWSQVPQITWFLHFFLSSLKMLRSLGTMLDSLNSPYLSQNSLLNLLTSLSDTFDTFREALRFEYLLLWVTQTGESVEQVETCLVYRLQSSLQQTVAPSTHTHKKIHKWKHPWSWQLTLDKLQPWPTFSANTYSRNYKTF
jgi:hypothetical protein